MELKLEGRCDRTRYHLDVPPDADVMTVRYRDLSVPKEYRRDIRVTRTFYLPPNSEFIKVDDSATDIIPDSEAAAYWYLRAVAENQRKPCFYYYKPLNLLVCFPPVANSGDQILVTVETPDALEPDTNGRSAESR